MTVHILKADKSIFLNHTKMTLVVKRVMYVYVPICLLLELLSDIIKVLPCFKDTKRYTFNTL